MGLLILFTGCGQKETGKKEAQSDASYDSILKDKLVLFATLPPRAENPNNPITEAKVKLGHALYYDVRLSRNYRISCNSCHNLSTFGVDNRPTSPGDGGEFGERNSPTTLNAAFHFVQFWDGRAKDVEEQAGGPILNPVEMAMPSEKAVIQRLKEEPYYQKRFKEAFPNEPNPITFENVKKAIAAFERVLVTPSRFDQYLQGDTKALTLEEKKGLLTFINTGCTSCHSGALLGGTTYQKFGVYGNYWEYTHSEKIDEGRYAITKNEMDKYFFKVPSLRNVAKTGPYFHDGNVASLDSAVRIMAKLQLNQNLSDEQVKNIVAFLNALTGDIPEEYKQPPADLPQVKGSKQVASQK
jgi:cytochrome c peroxidase